MLNDPNASTMHIVVQHPQGFIQVATLDLTDEHEYQLALTAGPQARDNAYWQDDSPTAQYAVDVMGGQYLTSKVDSL